MYMQQENIHIIFLLFKFNYLDKYKDEIKIYNIYINAKNYENATENSNQY